MPVSEALRRACQDPGFWTGATSPTAVPPPSAVARPGPDPAPDGTPPAELRVSLPVTAGYGLVLEIDPVTGERTLGLRGPASSEPVQLGWGAPGRPYPAALRWWELDLCARVIALDDPTLPHPGLVVALLSPFAPATADDDPREIAAVRAAAYRSLRREPEGLPAPVRRDQLRTPGEREPDPLRTPGHRAAGPRPGEPEQDPLPLFADARWWPSPEPAPAGGDPAWVLDEATVQLLAAPAAAHLEVRGGARFPSDEIADLVRRAAARLSRHGEDDCYAAARPLARRIAGSGDLQPVRHLLATLTEAGCDHPTVLDALSEPLVPLEACWIVETLADVAPGTLLRRHV
ncbi:hypothetical protein KRMM14A1259_43190 [Krasilnikovia sp. MM14-A1259]